MARTSAGAVKSILMDDFGPKLDGLVPSLTPFIETANALISRVITCAGRKDITISTTEAELLERWMAAHFYVMSDQNYTSKSTASASASFQGQTGKRFEASKYGQTAMTIDPSGCLEAINMGVNRTASAKWLGKTDTEKLDYEDRN